MNAQHSIPGHSSGHFSSHPLIYHGGSSSRGVDFEWESIVFSVLILLLVLWLVWSWSDKRQAAIGMFRCDKCGKDFPIVHTEEEKKAEALKNLGYIPTHPETVCDGCYENYLKEIGKGS